MNQTEHQCPYCELRFAYMVELKDHVAHDHPAHRDVVDGLDPHELPGEGRLGGSGAGHQCPSCELRFASTSELREHLAVDHPHRGAAG